jgi:hypothetical protein
LEGHAAVAQEHLSDRDTVEQIDADLTSLAVDDAASETCGFVDPGDHHAEKLIRAGDAHLIVTFSAHAISPIPR